MILTLVYVFFSAIGHFKKQFAYLEENIGKSGPVIPPERKHVSLPRLTFNFGFMFHLLKEQLSWLFLGEDALS